MPKHYEDLRDEALGKLRTYMDSLDPIKGKKLAYWIEDYVRFLGKERTFCPSKLIRYKRGAIVKVHLGYRVGSEEGGLHYAVVMDRDNPISSPVITVIPLTSVKTGTDLKRLHFTNVFMGNEVYSLLSSNFAAELRSARQRVKDIEEFSKNLSDAQDLYTLQQRTAEVNKQISYCERMKNEASRMKQGSIALVGQITTVSKIRIYDPMHHGDALSQVRISAPTLDLLDAKVQELFGPQSFEPK